MRKWIIWFLCVLPIAFQAQDTGWTRIQQKAKEAKLYCKSHGMNQQYCVLVDMKIHSGKNRLFVYDFKKDTLVDQSLVSHGCGPHQWGEDATKSSPVFSNTPESHLSSLGKYKIGSRGYSSWGIHVKYWLHGLEKSNSNAKKRIIVLHGWSSVPERPTYPVGCPKGWGCPAVSNAMMKRLDKRLKAPGKPVLLWMFN